MDVWVIGMFSELNNVSLVAVDDRLDRARNVPDQWTELSCFLICQIGDSRDMPTDNQNRPALNCCSVRMYYIPPRTTVDHIPWRSLTDVTSLDQIAGLTLGDRRPKGHGSLDSED